MIGIVILGVAFVLVLALCKAASNADESADEMLRRMRGDE